MKLQEKEYLEIYKKQNEDLLQWGSSENWSNKDFENLADLIFEKTGITLSISTLKRVWGKVKYDSIPTTTTLDTLAQFSGYENWRNFCSQIKVNGQNGNGVSSTIKEESKPSAGKKSRQWIPAAIVAGLILIFALIWMSFFYKTSILVNNSEVSFSSKKVTDDLPNSVVFSYDVGENKTDSVIIQQSWDPKRREYVSVHNHQHTSIYYYPGFFKAKLLINGAVVKEHEVYIRTNGWKGIIQQEPLPIYLSNEEIELSGNAMKITPTVLQNKLNKTVFNEALTSFYNVQAFKNINAGDFTVSATLRNTSSKEQAICQNVKFTIWSPNGVITIPLSGKGCTSALGVYLVDKFIDGKEKDLSAFGCDFSQPQNIQCKIKNKTLDVFLNNKLVFHSTFTTPLERIVGVNVTFEGAGEIKDFSIK